MASNIIFGRIMKYFNIRFLLFSTVLISCISQLSAQLPKVILIDSGFVFQEAPFANCHASTMVVTSKDSTLYAWFGGDHEGAKDVKIWGAWQNLKTGKFGTISLLATGMDSAGNPMASWNPVLFKTQKGVLFLDYKVGPNPREWWAERKISYDNGLHWSNAIKLPKGFLGPIKNKPIQLKNGTILYPSSTESLDEKVWAAHLESTDGDGNNWEYIPIDRDTFSVIQPSILNYKNKTLQLLLRSRQNRVVSTWSKDNGQTWSQLDALDLPNPNSGTDAVTLRNGWQLLVYNPLLAGKEWWEGRSELRLAFSKDGKKWHDIYTLEHHKDGEYSYPAIIQAPNGEVLISYTFRRTKIKSVRLHLR